MVVMTALELTGHLADRDRWSADRCSMAATLDVVGRRATFLLLREAFYGARRYDEFVRRSELSEAVVAARLRELVDEELLVRVPYREPGQRAREGYELTPKGRELLPAIIALKQWGDRWLTDDGGPLRFDHAGCGAPVHTELRCEEGHRVDGDRIEVAVARRR